MVSNSDFVRAIISNRKLSEIYLQGLNDNTVPETKAVVRNRLKKFKQNDLNNVPEKKRATYEENLNYLLENIKEVDRLTEYINDTMNGNYQPLIDFLNATDKSLRQKRRIHKTFKDKLDTHPKKEEFKKYILENEQAKKSIIGKLLNISSEKNTKEIKTDIEDKVAIEYLKYILTSKDFVEKQRKDLFPKSNLSNGKFEPIEKNTRLFPALSFLLNNEQFDKEYTWVNEAPSNLRLKLTIKKLTKNIEDKNAVGVQKLFNSTVRKTKSSRTGIRDVGQRTGATVGEGTLRNINVFLKKLEEEKNKSFKKEFNNLLLNQRVPSKAILNTEWQLIVDYLDGKAESRSKLQNYLKRGDDKKGDDKKEPKPNPILGIKKIQDVKRILNTKDKIQVFKEMALSKRTFDKETKEEIDKESLTRRVKNQQEIELLSSLFYRQETAKDILLEKFNEDFFEEFKETKTFLTDNKYNASREELPDILEFIEEVEFSYHDTTLLSKAFEKIENANNTKPVYDLNTGISTTALGDALLDLLEVCSDQYPNIRKSFISSIKKSMKDQSTSSALDSYDSIMNWFENKKLLSEVE